MTEKLLAEANACVARFETMREQDAVPDFFQDVKPHVDLIDKTLADWKIQMTSYIDKHQPKYVHHTQINAAEEGMKQFIVQSFYKETGKKRFYQSVHAVIYTLETVQTELRRAES